MTPEEFLNIGKADIVEDIDTKELYLVPDDAYLAHNYNFTENRKKTAEEITDSDTVWLENPVHVTSIVLEKNNLHKYTLLKKEECVTRPEFLAICIKDLYNKVARLHNSMINLGIVY